jgi:nitric oxide reductase
LVSQRLEEPKNDLISLLVREQLVPGHIAHADVVQIAFLLLVAGNATMVSMIALGVVELLQHPDQLALFIEDPDKWTKPFVEELCRYHTASALATKRVAKEDIVLGGKTIKSGEGIIAATQSGNRDEDIFPNSDLFDMRRERGNEEALGYGWGPHRCIAEWLARAELEIAFGKMLLKTC